MTLLESYKQHREYSEAMARLLTDVRSSNLA